MPTIVVDGVMVEAAEGASILQALDDAGLLMNGVDIPHYCWHPKLSIDGSCRLCQVEVEGMPKLQVACSTPVRDGMSIRTQNERVKHAREGVMEMLLINHPLDCPICDQAGECKLQDYAYEYGIDVSRTREPRRAEQKNVDLGPTIVFDQERCILCRRCVRFCREVSQSGELAVLQRGDASVIGTFPGEPLDNPYSMNVADLCPVGALTTKDFRFKVRVWFLEEAPGVCTGCSRGCNLYAGVANNKVYRYVPRRNDEVNQTWLCDAGRLSYKQIVSHRVRQSLLRGVDGQLEAHSYEHAIAEAARRIGSLVSERGPSAIAGVASAHATNEELFVFRRMLDALGVERSGVAVARGDSDDLLIQPEKGANAEGARAIGFGDASAVAEGLRSGTVHGLITLGHDLLDPAYLGGVDLLRQLECVVAIDTHHSELDRVAHVLLPGRHAGEKQGSLTNHAGRVQRVRPFVEPAWEAHDEGDSIVRIAAALGLAGFEQPYDPRKLSAELSLAISAFRGIELEALGEEGLMLARSPGWVQRPDA